MAPAAHAGHGAPEREAVTGNVAEVFRSYQGEGLLLGARQVFVRLSGCEVGCRYCDTEWALSSVASVAVPKRAGESAGESADEKESQRLDNPLTVQQVLDLVERVDGGGAASVSLTGGEPLEQPGFAAALCAALSPREVMLETSGLDAAALAVVVPHVRWVACDLKLPTATGRASALDEHAAVLESGVLDEVEVFYKLIVDGDVPTTEVARAADLLRRHAPGARVFLQPVTAHGGSPALPRERLDPFVDLLAAAGLDVRVVPQVHKVLHVR